MAGLLPDLSLWGIVDYITYFVTFSVVFTVFNGMFAVIGDDVEAMWGRQN